MPQIILVCEATNVLFLQIGHSNLLLSEPFSVQVETEIPPAFRLSMGGAYATSFSFY